MALIVLAGALFGERTFAPSWVRAMNSEFVSVMLMVAGGMVAYHSAVSLGKDMERGRHKTQSELFDGTYIVARDDKRLVLLYRKDSPDADAEFYRLEEPLADEVLVVEAKCEGGIVSVEPYPVGSGR